jgi:hypothetical protein
VPSKFVPRAVVVPFHPEGYSPPIHGAISLNNLLDLLCGAIEGCLLELSPWWAPLLGSYEPKADRMMEMGLKLNVVTLE